jgi:hypothetical protein
MTKVSRFDFMPYGRVLDKNAYRLNAFENESGKHSWAHKTAAPLGVIGGSRVCSDNLIERPALLFESRYPVADSNQKIAIEAELRFVGDLAVSWDHDHLIRDLGQIRFGSANLRLQQKDLWLLLLTPLQQVHGKLCPSLS